MTRYHLHIHECGKIVRDEEGNEFPDLDSALKEAVSGARAIMCAELAEGRLCLSCHIEIEDGEGRAVARLPFSDAVELTGVPAG